MLLRSLKIDQIMAYRAFGQLILKLKLTQCSISLKKSLDACERLGYCRFKDHHQEYNEQYNKPCIHFT